MKKIGIISDTHGTFDGTLREFLKDVDEIWHAGDIGSLELADAAKEVGHRVIAAFRIDRHVDETRLRLVSVVDETEAQLLEDRVRLTPEVGVQAVEVARLMKHADGSLHLAARFERHRNAFARESDQMAVLPVFLAFVIIRSEPFEERFDAVRLVVAYGRVVGVMHRQMLNLDT